MPRLAHSFAPILLGATAAAHFLGVSESTLRTLGIPRKMLGAKRLYDHRDLIAYVDELDYEAERNKPTSDEEACDEAFGLSVSRS